MFRSKTHIAETLLLALALGAHPAEGHQPKMYWVASGGGTFKVWRADLDGSNREVLIPEGLVGPIAIALDVDAEKMYLTDASTDKILRANMDGSGLENLVTGVRSFAIAVDPQGGKMYWADRLSGKMQRANLDGSGIEDLITSGLSGPGGIALDVAAGKMYWTNTFLLKIQRADLSGSNVEDLLTIAEPDLYPRGIALDLTAGKMYWTLLDIPFGKIPGKIQRANLDGSEIEDLVARDIPFVDCPSRIALDIRAGKMYWTNPGFQILRANFDGSGQEDIIAAASPRGIALDLRINADIPTASEWGLLMITLLVLTAGTVLIARRWGAGQRQNAERQNVESGNTPERMFSGEIR